jgi:hypothetical protein
LDLDKAKPKTIPLPQFVVCGPKVSSDSDLFEEELRANGHGLLQEPAFVHASHWMPLHEARKCRRRRQDWKP